MKKVIIATRGSKLALWQAEHVRERLEARHAGLEVELLVLKTKGDIILDVPLAKVGEKGFSSRKSKTRCLPVRRISPCTA